MLCFICRGSELIIIMLTLIKFTQEPRKGDKEKSSFKAEITGMHYPVWLMKNLIKYQARTANMF